MQKYTGQRKIKVSTNPIELDTNWDILAGSYYIKKEFLQFLHNHNYCNQLYYELYEDDVLVAGTIAYTVKTNLLTFLDIPTPVSFRVIGIPVSVASPPFIGKEEEMDYLLDNILNKERGLILGLNFLKDHLAGKVVNMRTLPTMKVKLSSDSMTGYLDTLRHHYRRRFHRITHQFGEVSSVTTECSAFSEEHYDLYLQIMKASTTKLEILKREVFANLPGNFQLTTISSRGIMLFWYILVPDSQMMSFFMCGMNYKYRDEFQIYNNSLFLILEATMKKQFNSIDLGQTAQTAKMRVGGVPEERRMFMYHKNPLFNIILKIFRNQISYRNMSYISGNTQYIRFEPVNKIIKRSFLEDHIHNQNLMILFNKGSQNFKFKRLHNH